MALAFLSVETLLSNLAVLIYLASFTVFMICAIVVAVLESLEGRTGTSPTQAKLGNMPRRVQSGAKSFKPDNGGLSLVAQRTRQLQERSRVCVFEDLCAQCPCSDRSTTCCICVSEIQPNEQVRSLACGHVFHLHCIADWFIMDKTMELTCPMCRVPLAQQPILD